MSSIHPEQKVHIACKQKKINTSHYKQLCTFETGIYREEIVHIRVKMSLH